MPRDIYKPPESDLGPIEKAPGLTVLGVLRWAALLPCVIFSWWLVFLLGGMSLLDHPALNEPGPHGILLFLGGLSAAVVILISYLVAPSAKYRVAKYSFIAGSLICVFIIFISIVEQNFGPFFYCAVAALVVGGACLWLLKRVSRSVG